MNNDTMPVVYRESGGRPLVSVITIFLNAEKFLQEAVESVFAQDFHNWELLLVDDGSTDASTEIARRYADRYAGKVRATWSTRGTGTAV